MPSLVFNSTDLGLLDRTLDLTTGTFYAHLVTTIPVATNQTVADLVLAAGGSYQPVTLAGRSIGTDGTGARLTFSDPTWTALWCAAATTIKGMVICRQAGGSPASTDKVISYLERTTAFTPATVSGGAVDFTLNIPSTGVLKAD